MSSRPRTSSSCRPSPCSRACASPPRRRRSAWKTAPPMACASPCSRFRQVDFWDTGKKPALSLSMRQLPLSASRVCDSSRMCRSRGVDRATSRCSCWCCMPSSPPLRLSTASSAARTMRGRRNHVPLALAPLGSRRRDGTHRRCCACQAYQGRLCSSCPAFCARCCSSRARPRQQRRPRQPQRQPREAWAWLLAACWQR